MLAPKFCSGRLLSLTVCVFFFSFLFLHFLFVQLHRKLSGAFLTCRKLEATVECKTAFLRLYNSYQFGPELPLEYGSASRDSVDSRLTPESI